MTKNPNYWDSLTDREKKGWSNWMILHGLSQDEELIPLCSYLWKPGYFDSIPPKHFYTLLCELVPTTNKKFGWVKSKTKLNKELLGYISQWYSISMREAEDYLSIFVSNDDGLKELVNIVQGFGLTDREIEKILGNNTDE